MTIFVNALADVVEIHSRTRESFKSKVNPWHSHGEDRWCGRWNQEETDAEFVAMQGEPEGKTRKERKKKRGRESRMSFRGRLTSLSTRLLISLCPRLFVSLFRFPTSRARKFESVKLLSPPPAIYIRDSSKLYTSQVGGWMNTDEYLYDQLCIFFFFSSEKKKRNL